MVAAAQAHAQGNPAFVSQCVQEVGGVFNISDEQMAGLAVNLVNTGHCSLAISEVAGGKLIEYHNSGAQPWIFHSSQHQCLMPFSEEFNPIIKSFFERLLERVVVLGLNAIQKPIENLTAEESALYGNAANSMGIDRFHFVRNPTRNEVDQTFDVVNRPNNLAWANACWERVRQTQERGGNYHTDIVPYFFTMVAALNGESTRYLPRNRVLRAQAQGTPLAPGMRGEKTLPEGCFNIWMGQSMANLLQGLGVSEALANSLLLRHRAPNTEPDPQRLAFIVGAMDTSFVMPPA